ncbi:ATP-binding protein [Schlesneria sp. T3-172]|uniref:ATP-binding protein n=1 Tax=Schlesneria sphaerica TaxID=3373610 RepID=UPI0037C8BF1F
MKTNFYKSLFVQALIPVFWVLALYISMNILTTYYVVWIERSNQRVFVENVVPVRAAEELKVVIWRMVAECPSSREDLPRFRERWENSKYQIAKERNRLKASEHVEGNQEVLQALEGPLNAYLDIFRGLFEVRETTNTFDPDLNASIRPQAIELAHQITVTANDIIRVNQHATDLYKEQRRRVTNTILWFRSGILLVGPLLGIFLGWRLSRRLNQSISRIAVTLHDAASKSDSNIGTIDINASTDFQEVQQKAEQFAFRMRQVSRDLQAARREVLQSERLAAVGELAAGVAHEIRNPLTSVKLLLQHAIRQASGPKLDESKLRLILEEIGRMESTIQGLLDFARPPQLNCVLHDLAQTLQRALNLVSARARQQGIEIIVRPCEVPLMVDGDTEKLHQVLVNLLINAIEAMPDGGQLTIEARIVERTHCRLSGEMVVEFGNCGTRMAQIVVKDTGEGISPDVLPRLFEPFATTKDRGTGLGLAVSHRIAEEHHGTITARNGETGGAQFTLCIPIIEFEVSGPSSRRTDHEMATS